MIFHLLEVGSSVAHISPDINVIGGEPITISDTNSRHWANRDNSSTSLALNQRLQQGRYTVIRHQGSNYYINLFSQYPLYINKPMYEIIQ